MPLPPAPRALLGIAGLITAGLVIAVLSGCSPSVYETRLIPPGEPEGQACLARCDLLKTQCRQRQETRRSECQTRYAAAKSDYQMCLSNRARNCRAPDTCLAPDLSICDQQYEACFANCGGRVERELRPWKGTGPQTPQTGTPQATPSKGPAS
jgi:hypothetical protein